MGSFNVACSISNMSINAGDKVAFIPLLPNKYAKHSGNGKECLPWPDSSLVYPHCYLNPFCLPIFGKYNDYGSVEEIEHDTNTKTVEKYLGITIEQLVKVCTCGRSVTDYMSESFQLLTPEPIKKAVEDYSYNFNSAYLELLGFKRVGPSGQAWYDFQEKDFPYLVKLVGNYKYDPNRTWVSPPRVIDFGYEIIDHEGKVVVSKPDGYDAKEELLRDIQKLTKYWIHIPKEKQELANLLIRMSGMFVHRDIYDKFVATNKHSDINYHTPVQQELEITRKEIKEYYEQVEKLKEKLKEAPDDMALFLIAWRHPMKSYNHEGILKYFDEWEYFREIYGEAVEHATMDQEIISYLNFYSNMYSANRFFFPGMNGEQTGNLEVSLMLALATKNVLFNRLKGRLEDGWYSYEELSDMAKAFYDEEVAIRSLPDRKKELTELE